MVKNYPSNHSIHFKETIGPQLSFIRNQLIDMVCKKYGHEWTEEFIKNMRVSGEYKDNSLGNKISFPIYHFIVPNGDQFQISNNLNFWYISVKMANVNMEADFMKIFESNEICAPDSCRLSKDWVFGSWAEDKKQFTIRLNPGFYEIYTFFRIYFFQVSKKEY